MGLRFDDPSQRADKDVAALVQLAFVKVGAEVGFRQLIHGEHAKNRQEVVVLEPMPEVGPGGGMHHAPDVEACILLDCVVIESDRRIGRVPERNARSTLDGSVRIQSAFLGFLNR